MLYPALRSPPYMAQVVTELQVTTQPYQRWGLTISSSWEHFQLGILEGVPRPFLS